MSSGTEATESLSETLTGSSVSSDLCEEVLLAVILVPLVFLVSM